MLGRKLLLAAATVATIAVSTIGTTAPASAYDPALPWAAGAAGLVGGMILGGALADQDRPTTYVRRPVRVYEEEVVVPRRCWREVWYDRYGDRHIRRLCR